MAGKNSRLIMEEAQGSVHIGKDVPGIGTI
jgi:hypothetical protein